MKDCECDIVICLLLLGLAANAIALAQRVEPAGTSTFTIVDSRLTNIYDKVMDKYVIRSQ